MALPLAPTSPWLQRVDDPSLELDPASAMMRDDFSSALLANPHVLGAGGPGTRFPPPQYWGDPSVVPVAVRIAAQHGGSVLDLPAGAKDEYGWKRKLAEALRDNPCPLPAGAQPSEGGDHWLILRDGYRMWCFEQFSYDADGMPWCTWGEFWQDTRRSTGFGCKGMCEGVQTCWPNWGVTATGASLRAGVLDIQDARRGRIDHALAVVVGNARAGVQARPAQRTDGGLQRPYAIVEGSRWRIDPAVDLASLALNPTAAMVADCWQRHGFIPDDKTGHYATLRVLQSPPVGDDPYAQWFPLGGESSPLADLARVLPHLQVLKMNLVRADEWDQTEVPL